MWNPTVDEAMPDFWPPRPGPFWDVVLGPVRRWFLRRVYRVADIDVVGLDAALAKISPGDGVLIAPNHSHDSDPHVMMEVARRAGRRFHFMAAWQIFRMHGGLDGWALQRMGAFSVDREGCDRRAVRQAVELLGTGQFLVVFPEGEVYHLNERLTPLLDGVAFMALSAQRDLTKAGGGRRVWIVPTAIRYRYADDVRPELQAAVAHLESRLLVKADPNAPLADRLLRLCDVVLTIQEKQVLGRVSDGALSVRVANFIEALLSRLEQRHLTAGRRAETVPLRVKALRRHLLDLRAAAETPPEMRAAANASLDEVTLVLTLYSYPGDYVMERPSVERIAETVEKLEEDIHGRSRPKGRRAARVVFGEPIDLSAGDPAARTKVAAGETTDRIEETIRRLLADASG
jgi:1-acyl-sn-glycerol-3-phosphate acyltransferase